MKANLRVEHSVASREDSKVEQMEGSRADLLASWMVASRGWSRAGPWDGCSAVQTVAVRVLMTAVLWVAAMAVPWVDERAALWAGVLVVSLVVWKVDQSVGVLVVLSAVEWVDERVACWVGRLAASLVAPWVDSMVLRSADLMETLKVALKAALSAGSWVASKAFLLAELSVVRWAGSRGPLSVDQ